MDNYRPGDANRITREYLDSLLIETRYIGSDLPETDMELFGKKFKTPIMTAAFSHLGRLYGCPTGMVDTAKGAYDAGAVMWAGMGERQELEDIIATGAATIKIVKPYADEERILTQLRDAEELGAFAVGMDIDHSFTRNGGYDNVFGDAMKNVTLEALRRYVSSVKLPFIVKGVLSVHDAVASREAGAAAILVSHHHGVCEYAVPPLMVLPEIMEAVGKDMPVFVDCGIDSGCDTFKALALGASGVCVGRKILDDLKRDGAAGVTTRINAMTNELRGFMARTCSENIRSIDPKILRRDK